MRAEVRRFEVDDTVRVRSGIVPGHIRTPFYLRGKRGRIVDVVGEFRNPEKLAYHEPGFPLCALYRVRFAQSDVWPAYDGTDADVIEADIYDHWLEHDLENHT